MLLPFLLRAAQWSPGTFVEIGALDGVLFSNTHVLERCFNWTGVLVEANSKNYERLQASSRRAAKVHAAACRTPGFVNVTLAGDNVAASPEAMSPGFHRRFGRANRHWRHERVPCLPLSLIMADTGLRDGAHFLSLDVEGAEETVLQTIDPACFHVILVEMDGTDRPRERRIHTRIEQAGLSLAPQLATRNSAVYIRPKRARWRLRRLRRQRASTDAAQDAQAADKRPQLKRCGEVIHPTGEYDYMGERYSGDELISAWKLRGPNIGAASGTATGAR